MLEVIEKLLILQDRDRKLIAVRDELDHIPFEKQGIQSKHSATSQALEQAKLGVQKIESARKRLELDVEDKKKLIEKYSNQQLQTKKNDEYRALAREIDHCNAEIRKIEDQELELMEQEEGARKVVAGAKSSEAEAQKVSNSRVQDLSAREENLRKELRELEANREELAAVVEDSTRRRYERLLQGKGASVLVGIQHAVCGGCHMQLSRQIVVSCQADQEIQTCVNCARILYYSPDMDLSPVD